jgi:hypothetical protein
MYYSFHNLQLHSSNLILSRCLHFKSKAAKLVRNDVISLHKKFPSIDLNIVSANNFAFESVANAPNYLSNYTIPTSAQLRSVYRQLLRHSNNYYDSVVAFYLKQSVRNLFKKRAKQAIKLWDSQLQLIQREYIATQIKNQFTKASRDENERAVAHKVSNKTLEIALSDKGYPRDKNLSYLQYQPIISSFLSSSTARSIIAIDKVISSAADSNNLPVSVSMFIHKNWKLAKKQLTRLIHLNKYFPRIRSAASTKEAIKSRYFVPNLRQLFADKQLNDKAKASTFDFHPIITKKILARHARLLAQLAYGIKGKFFYDLQRYRMLYLFRHNEYLAVRAQNLHEFHRYCIENFSFFEEEVRTRFTGQLLYNSINTWPARYRAVYFQMYGMDLPKQFIAKHPKLTDKGRNRQPRKKKPRTNIDFEDELVEEGEEKQPHLHRTNKKSKSKSKVLGYMEEDE